MEGAAETGSGSQVADSPESEQNSIPAEAADAAAVPPGPERGPSRVGRRWAVGIAAGLTLAAAAVATGGYFSLRDHQASERIDAGNIAAVAAAKECVAATQVPSSPDMVEAERRILECATGQFYMQALQNSGMFVKAFRLGQVHTEVAEIRAAPERDYPDGSVDVLVAFRVKVDNVEAKGKEYGYRLRAQMTPVDGVYRIAALQQVSR